MSALSRNVRRRLLPRATAAYAPPTPASPPPVRREGAGRAAELADWRDVHDRSGDGPRSNQPNRRRAMRATQTGRDLPQGEEPPAVRADAAGERPRGGAEHRRARGTHGARGGAGTPGCPRGGPGGRAHGGGRARGGDGPGRGAGRRRAGDRPRLPCAASGQDPGGCHRRRDRPDQPGQRHVRGAGAPPRQALPHHLRAAQRPHRGPGERRPRAEGQPQAPGHGDLRRGRRPRGVRVHRRPAGTGRAAGRDERPGGRADVRRDRLPGRRVPDDAPRPALCFPAFLGHAADRPGIHLQGLRPRSRPRPVPGPVAPVRGPVRQGTAVTRHLRRRPPPGGRAAPADA